MYPSALTAMFIVFAAVLAGPAWIAAAEQEDTPIDISSQRELFVDRYLIDRLDGARLVLHHPKPREVSLTFDQPWERNVGYMTVFRDGGTYRLYYRGMLGNKDEDCATCYAESQDGVHWTRPKLGLFDAGKERGKANNIVWRGSPSLCRGVNAGKQLRLAGATDYLRTQALSRLVLDNIQSITSSWVTVGPKIGQLGLFYGANDMGSVMMEENVVSAAGTTHCLNEPVLCHLIREAGFVPAQRDNKYRRLHVHEGQQSPDHQVKDWSRHRRTNLHRQGSGDEGGQVPLPVVGDRAS